jgi:SAM-dependent methyltransferase
MEKQEYKIMAEIENDYWWYRGLHELVLAMLKKIFSERKDINILDAGCGTGRMLELIGLSGYGNAVGFDYSPEAVDFCLQRGLKNIRQEDLNAWQPEEGKEDCIVSLDVLYHSAVVDDLAVMKKFHRALKPQGRLILNLPAFEFLKRGHDAAVWTKKRYRAGSLKKDLLTAGFEIEILSYRLPWLFFIVLAVKIKNKIFPAPEARSDLKKSSKLMNAFWLALNRLDNEMIKCGIYLPLGSSVFVVAKKK